LWWSRACKARRCPDWRWIMCSVCRNLCLFVSSRIRWNMEVMSRRTMAEVPSMCFLLVNLVNIRRILFLTQRKLRLILNQLPMRACWESEAFRSQTYWIWNSKFHIQKDDYVFKHCSEYETVNLSYRWLYI